MRERLLAHIDAAASRLRSRRTLSDDDVHAARKSIKRSRAVLRLLQPALETDEAARSRIALRDAGRILSPARDAKVLADRFAEMLERSGVDAFAVSTIPAAAASRNPTARDRVRDRTHGDAARTGLLNAHRWLAAATLMGSGWAPLATGIRAIYKSGRNQQPADVDAAASEALHEWRKRVKNYLYALEALAQAERPPAVRRTIDAARRLADTLGEEHDLAMLDEALRTSDECQDARVRALLDAIALRRRRLRRRAYKVGTALYADTPATMVKHLRRK